MARREVPRLAWFSPLPPSRSGIARYSFEILPELASSFEITVFVDGPPAEVESPDSRIAVRNAHDIVWLHTRRPFDLVVYQFGNADCHDYMWGYVARFPGLVVLHDGQLHHARGRLLREQQRYDDYLREFSYNHPGIDRSIGELGAGGRLGRLQYMWPMRRTVVRAARAVAVHNQYLADAVREDVPDVAVHVIDMGVPHLAPAPDARAVVRKRHDIPDDAVLFLSLGTITPEKRIAEAIRQLAAIADAVPHARLLLAGAATPHFDAMAQAAAHGIADRVRIAGFIPHDALADYMEAADVCLSLRWPTSRETSAAWLRCLAAGRPTIVTDLAHTTDVPAYDPRGWAVMHSPARHVDRDGWPLAAEPACVAIDLLDEEHSLQLAMQRLATDPFLRERLGHAARALWRERFTLEAMASRYVDVLNEVSAAPVPADVLHELPSHFSSTHMELTTRVLGDMGISSLLDSLWSPNPRP